ncbi:MAG: hypothetical protein KDE51_09925, partial [Anaerolineales bacterium]|nr:hypothetical protein [Anaerolineales bacterium]
ATPFAAARQLVQRLGAHWKNGRAEFGFWVPELFEADIPAERIFLEILSPSRPLDFQAAQQTITFKRERLPLLRDEDYVWGVVDGLTAGSRQQVGTFYWLAYQDREQQWHHIIDPLAYSVPFGAFAPAELYDIDGMLAQRGDKEHFRHLEMATTAADGIPRLDAPTNFLEIHTNTATAEGSLASLTRLYQHIGEKIEAGEPLTAAENTFIGYDGVQLMPIEPTIVHEAGPAFWETDSNDPDAPSIEVTLRKPDTSNWGYDIVIAGSPAPNPIVLASKRPDELLDFIVAMHNFPGKPIKVIFDIVYGHNDNQSLRWMNRFYFAGANMYGQNNNFLHPVVRAVLLEMQRRKSNYGVDGIRVDGAQDFKYWVPETDELLHDDEYLREMNDLIQEVDGVKYRPWMIFEDGRPWPRADWELASSYREVTKQFPNVVQWGPLTFAHNTPFLFTFWISKWWRIRELMQVGSHWITGCSNHDTLRRGTQVDPEARINTFLGDSLPEIFANAYDNFAAVTFTYAFSPGVPMDFVQASMRAPWSFIRNTDDKYGVKVVSEEAYFLDWLVTNGRFQADDAFPRLKALGFSDVRSLKRFMRALDGAVKTTDYYLESMVSLLNALEPQLPAYPFTVTKLKAIAKAWMDDMADYCNVSHWAESLEEAHTLSRLKIRNFRRERPWLRGNLAPQDHFDYLYPTDGTIIFYGLRNAPDGREQILFVANMEGKARQLTPAALPIDNLTAAGWELALAPAALTNATISESVTLHDSQALVFVRAQS